MSDWNVYSGNETNRWKDRLPAQGGSCDIVVKAKSKAHAVRILSAVTGKMSLGHFNDYWHVTGSDLHLALCRGDFAQAWALVDDACIRIYDSRTGKEIL